MDKVNSSMQSRPLWERQKSNRGHHSSVDAALDAHRQRTMNRQARVQARLNMVKDIQSDFFPKPQIQSQTTAPQMYNSPTEQLSVPNSQQVSQELIALQEVEAFQPQQIDEMYKEAQLGTTSDNALAVVEKEISNPEEGPVDDIPKGSYVDYTV